MTVQGAEKIKPWGMLGVIVLLQVDGINRAFFDLVLWFYDLTPAPRIMYAAGSEFFKFWQKMPL